MPTQVGRLKYDWYQKDDLVVISVLIKKLNENDVKVQFSQDSVELDCQLPDGTEQKLHLRLLKLINPDESNVKVSASKLEMQLKKVDPSRWPKLEADVAGRQAEVIDESSAAAVEANEAD